MVNLSMNKEHGKLIVYEGIDGAGKTTQMQRTAAWLKHRGYRLVMLREPTYGPYGMKLRASASAGRLSAAEERDLFVQDRRWNVTTNILPALFDGQIVLLDRYYFSSIAYQGARGLDLQAIRAQNEAIAPRPDLVLLFDLEPEMAVLRIEKQRGETPNLFENLDYLRRVRAIFLALEDPFIVRLDAQLPMEQVWQQVEEALLPLFAHKKNP